MNSLLQNQQQQIQPQFVQQVVPPQPPNRPRAREFPLSAIRFLQELGEGAFGKVYKDTMTVAVKKIRNFDKKEVKEVETLMSLNHKFIIKCYGHHFEDNGRTLCIVMEFADKGTFTKLITEEAPNPGSNYFKEFNIWRFLCQLSLALDYLHTLPQPILHRDLKPENILGVIEDMDSSPTLVL